MREPTKLGSYDIPLMDRTNRWYDKWEGHFKPSKRQVYMGNYALLVVELHPIN